jgi:hypothetical protein
LLFGDLDLERRLDLRQACVVRGDNKTKSDDPENGSADPH